MPVFYAHTNIIPEGYFSHSLSTIQLRRYEFIGKNT